MNNYISKRCQMQYDINHNAFVLFIPLYEGINTLIAYITDKPTETYE